MKKGFVVVLFVLVSLSAFSQSQFALGIKGGLNFANLSSSSVSGVYNNRTGYHAGAFVLMRLGKIGIQPEIIYSKQGSTFSLNGQDLASNYDYINIPILLKIYIIDGVNLQVGPQIGFLAGGNKEVLINNIKTPVNLLEYAKSTDFSLAFGLGWDFSFGLSLDARYNLGFSDINNAANQSRIENQVIQISFGFKLINTEK